jgi:hypothetical protein
VHWLLVTANIVPSATILVTLLMEELHSSETSVLTRATRRNIQKTAFFKDIDMFIVPFLRMDFHYDRQETLDLWYHGKGHILNVTDCL